MTEPPFPRSPCFSPHTLLLPILLGIYPVGFFLVHNEYFIRKFSSVTESIQVAF